MKIAVIGSGISGLLQLIIYQNIMLIFMKRRSFWWPFPSDIKTDKENISVDVALLFLMN